MPCCFWIEDRSGEGRGCQFDVPEENLTEYAGLSYCRFHLPVRMKEGGHGPKFAWDTGQIAAFNKDIFAIIDAAKGDNLEADLTGVVFPGAIDFRRYDAEHPLPKIVFTRATFSGDADFREAAFSGDADFTKAAFSGDANFREAAFSGGAIFGEAAFSGGALFREAAFSGPANFRKATFSGDAYFREAAFFGDAYFWEAAFSGGAIFGEAAFSGDADFGKAAFSGPANFRKATFSGDAYFREAAFSGFANFREAIFEGDALFTGAAAVARGEEPARAAGSATAEGGAEARNPVLARAQPDRSVFHRVDFSDAHFRGACDFNNRRFLDATSFRNAIFEGAPKFHNALLHQDTDFAGAKFKDVTNEDAARNYRTLKLAMEQVRARQEEAMFFALEQKSLRKQKDTPWTVRLASAIYDWGADYGQSFVRPFLWIIVFSAIFGAIYASVLFFVRDPALAASPPCEFDYVAFTLRQIFRPFELWSTRPDLIEPFTCYGVAKPPLILKLLATLHSLTTFGLFTLFLLALRKHFRMI